MGPRPMVLLWLALASGCDCSGGRSTPDTGGPYLFVENLGLRLDISDFKPGKGSTCQPALRQTSRGDYVLTVIDRDALGGPLEQSSKKQPESQLGALMAAASRTPSGVALGGCAFEARPEGDGVLFILFTAENKARVDCRVVAPMAFIRVPPDAETRRHGDTVVARHVIGARTDATTGRNEGRREYFRLERERSASAGSRHGVCAGIHVASANGTPSGQGIVRRVVESMTFGVTVPTH